MEEYEEGPMPRITPESMNMLTVNDIVRVCEEVGIINKYEVDDFHRSIRNWTDKSLIFSWGRAGQSKTSGRLYSFDQVYRAAFAYVLAAIAGHDIDKLAAALDAFEGKPAQYQPHGRAEEEAELQEEYASAVYHISQGRICHFIKGFKRGDVELPDGTRDLESYMGLVFLDGESGDQSLGAALQTNGDMHALAGLDLPAIVKPILGRDPRHELGIIPYVLEHEKAGPFAGHIYKTRNAAMGNKDQQ